MLIFSNGSFTSEQLPSISWEKDEDVSEGNEDVPAFVVSAALLDRYDISSHLVLSYLIYQKDLAQLYLHWCLPLCILMLLLTCQIKAEYIRMIHSIEYYFYPSIFCIRNLCFFFLMVVYLWTVTLNIRGEKDKDIPEENEDDSNFVVSAALLDIDTLLQPPLSPPVLKVHHQRFWVPLDLSRWWSQGHHRRFQNRWWWGHQHRRFVSGTVGDGDINTAGWRHEPAVKTFFPSKKIFSYNNIASLWKRAINKSMIIFF